MYLYVCTVLRNKEHTKSIKLDLINKTDAPPPSVLFTFSNNIN